MPLSGKPPLAMATSKSGLGLAANARSRVPMRTRSYSSAGELVVRLTSCNISSLVFLPALVGVAAAGGADRG